MECWPEHCFAVVKAFAGISGHSFALVADAIESSTDILASLLVYAGLRYATRPADGNHPTDTVRLNRSSPF